MAAPTYSSTHQLSVHYVKKKVTKSEVKGSKQGKYKYVFPLYEMFVLKVLQILEGFFGVWNICIDFTICTPLNQQSEM